MVSSYIGHRGRVLDHQIHRCGVRVSSVGGALCAKRQFDDSFVFMEHVGVSAGIEIWTVALSSVHTRTRTVSCKYYEYFWNNHGMLY